MRILDVLTSPWAISPSRLHEILGIYRAHLRGEKIDWKAMQEKLALVVGDRPQREAYPVIDGVAVIEVKGVLTKGMSFFSYLFGGSSMKQIGKAIAAAVSDQVVKAILLDVDSPGGTVDGTEELAEAVYQARGVKPIVAFTDGMMASAAYWIASGADALYISGDTVEVGSIGVVATHIDQSKWDEMMGDKYTEITAGRYKRLVSAHKPLTDEGAGYLQDQVDYIYSAFVDAVARNRGVDAEEALQMADGKIFIGRQSVEVGLVDGVSTFDELAAKLAAGESLAASQNNAEKEDMIVTLEELKTKHPAVYAEALAEGKTAGLAEATDAARLAGIEEGRSQGAATERERILSVQEALIPGHEQIVAEAVRDGKSTAGEVALKICAAEKQTRDAVLEQYKKDGASAAAVPAVAAPIAPAPANPDLPLDERAKADWDKDAELRKEFKTIEAYKAFLANAEAGHVRIFGKK